MFTVPPTQDEFCHFDLDYFYNPLDHASRHAPKQTFSPDMPSYIICCHNHGHGADMRGCSQSPVVPEGNPKNPEFKHQEITGPTVERDVMPLANETREVHVQFKLGLGGWISYMTQFLPIPESQYRVFWHLGYFIGVHDEARVEAEVEADLLL
ncbi:hypothetical protein CQW23_20430 [Capsicum baccatum]|uniref:Uncharacterized protein n=1 Tax=Capsicum baccatum TaxID=33114 RepID=A0A2G2W8M3_CAPBA|nr:hypothetical protein CQW23_20430 [Capsicum baccatum]